MMSPDTKFRPELIDLFVSMPEEHQRVWKRFVKGTGKLMYSPDLVLAPDGNPYIYRWYLVALDRNGPAETQIMFHVQVASDPERPLHDHPWTNVSHLLAGEYEEIFTRAPWVDGSTDTLCRCRLHAGTVTRRAATDAHRIILPHGVPYAMSLFTTGPKIREWGFWYPDGWHDNKRHVADRDGQSIHVNEEVFK